MLKNPPPGCTATTAPCAFPASSTGALPSAPAWFSGLRTEGRAAAAPSGSPPSGSTRFSAIYASASWSRAPTMKSIFPFTCWTPRAIQGAGPMRSFMRWIGGIRNMPAKSTTPRDSTGSSAQPASPATISPTSATPSSRCARWMCATATLRACGAP